MVTLGSERTQPASLGVLKHKTVFAIGDSAAMSFGSLRVMDARVAPGLTNQQLAGMTHGISGLIDARSSQLQVSIAPITAVVRKSGLASTKVVLTIM